MRSTSLLPLVFISVIASQQPSNPDQIIPLSRKTIDLVGVNGLIDWDQHNDALKFVNAKYGNKNSKAGLQKRATSVSSSIPSTKATSTASKTTSTVSKPTSTIKAASTMAAAAKSSSTSINSKVRSTAIAKPSTTPAYGVQPLAYKNGGALWTGSLMIGTPPVAYTALFDSGSSDTWIPSSRAHTRKQEYHDEKSNTSRALGGRDFYINYADGSRSSGPVFNDTLTIAGMKVVNATFAACDKISGTIASSPFDGIVGLGYPSISGMKNPIFQTLQAQGKVASPSFSFKLTSGDSELFLGGMNPSKFVAGSTSWYPVIEKAYWSIAGSITSNGTKIDLIKAIIDTGTTLIVGPADAVAAFYNQIPGSYLIPDDADYSAGYWTYPCSSSPNASFNFGDSKNYVLPMSSFNLGRADYSTPARCVGSVVSAYGVTGEWIVGDRFLQNVYSTFSFGTDSVGFSTLA